jgi:hypothetical protein
LSQRASDLAVDPNLRIVVERGFKHNRRTGGIEAANSLRRGYGYTVPGETEPSGRAPLVKSRWADHLPLRIVEVGAAGVGSMVISLDRGSRWLAVGSRAAEVHLEDPGVAVAPFARDQSNPVAGGQINGGIWLPAGQAGVHRPSGQQSRKQQRAKTFVGLLNSAAVPALPIAMFAPAAKVPSTRSRAIRLPPSSTTAITPLALFL